VHTYGKSWSERIAKAASFWNGAFSLTIIAGGKLYAVRDPYGFRPLCLGKIDDSGWVVASESSALYTIGANYVRDVEAGEIIEIDEDGYRSFRIPRETKIRAFCMFEYVYLARPDSVINKHTVYKVRKKMGNILAREHPVEADMVIPVPDSGVPAAIGYAQESGIPFGEGLIKNRYIGRTFIKPDQNLRQQGINLKLNALKYEISGKRLVLVDDSIVRGNTTNRIVDLLKKSGATEVHLRISSSPIISPCYFGVDINDKKELIAAKKSVKEIQAHSGADSLGYISLEGMIEATGMEKKDFCLGCFSGRYPIPIQMEMDKLILE
jgi:amidophosphoribosyltransferase